MSLTRKLLFALLAGFLAVLSASAWISVRRQAALFDSDVRRDHFVLGHALARELGRVLVSEGVGAAAARTRALVEPRDQVRVSWVALDGAGAPAVLRPEDRELLRAGQDVTKQLRGDDAGPDTLLTYVPVAPAQGFALEIAESLREAEQFLRHTVRNAVVSTLVLLLVTGVLAWSVGRHFVARPIQAIIDKIRHVAAGDLTGEIRLSQRDELAQIAAALNDMSNAIARANEKLTAETQARLATVEQLRHADRLMTVGKLASGLAHELGTPLSVISGRAEMTLLAEGDTSDGEAKESARIIRDQTQRMATIIRQLLDFARKHPPQKRPLEIRAIAERAVGLLSPLAEARGVRLELAPAAGATTASVDDRQIQQVLANLIANGLQATGSGGRVTVDVRSAFDQTPPDDLPAGGRRPTVRISVEDTGCGMTDEVRARIFEPFFTTKPVGEGTGLGLSVAYGIVREHGGWIDVESRPGQGSALAVHLPVDSDGQQEVTP